MLIINIILGQYPEISTPRLIDLDTPQSAYTKTGYDGETWNLVYSDEFNKDGRTFYPGDDPFWEAMDIHYWPTGLVISFFHLTFLSF